MTRVAAIDCGTNSIRLLVADATVGEDGRTRLADLTRQMRIVRLGKGVDARGYLDPGAILRTVEATIEYQRMIEKLGATRTRFVATSATRDASNSAEFVRPDQGRHRRRTRGYRRHGGGLAVLPRCRRRAGGCRAHTHAGCRHRRRLNRAGAGVDERQAGDLHRHGCRARHGEVFRPRGSVRRRACRGPGPRDRVDRRAAGRCRESGGPCARALPRGGRGDRHDADRAGPWA